MSFYITSSFIQLGESCSCYKKNESMLIAAVGWDAASQVTYLSAPSHGGFAVECPPSNGPASPMDVIIAERPPADPGSAPIPNRSPSPSPSRSNVVGFELNSGSSVTINSGMPKLPSYCSPRPSPTG